jgi:hypothetical protein
MRALLSLAAVLILAALALAWMPVNVNDTGSLNDDGFHRWVTRGHDLSSRRSLFGRESRFFIHFLRPEVDDIETVMLGDLRFNEFLPPCADRDTLRGRFVMAFSGSVEEVDTMWDWNSEPVWTSPPVAIPYTGYTTRYFFSSRSRLQGNAWDQLVTQLDTLFGTDPPSPIVIRFMPEGQSGFIINDAVQPFSMAYSTDLSQETDFLDVGDTRIRYLSPAEALAFHGSVIRGISKRDPWTSQRALFHFFLPGGIDLAPKELTIPWLEDQTRLTIYLGLTPEFVAQYPTVTYYANGRPPEVPTQCRVDTLTTYYRP